MMARDINNLNVYKYIGEFQSIEDINLSELQVGNSFVTVEYHDEFTQDNSNAFDFSTDEEDVDYSIFKIPVINTVLNKFGNVVEMLSLSMAQQLYREYEHRNAIITEQVSQTRVFLTVGEEKLILKQSFCKGPNLDFISSKVLKNKSNESSLGIDYTDFYLDDKQTREIKIFSKNYDNLVVRTVFLLQKIAGATIIIKREHVVNTLTRKIKTSNNARLVLDNDCIMSITLEGSINKEDKAISYKKLLDFIEKACGKIDEKDMFFLTYHSNYIFPVIPKEYSKEINAKCSLYSFSNEERIENVKLFFGEQFELIKQLYDKIVSFEGVDVYLVANKLIMIGNEEVYSKIENIKNAKVRYLLDLIGDFYQNDMCTTFDIQTGLLYSTRNTCEICKDFKIVYEDIDSKIYEYQGKFSTTVAGTIYSDKKLMYVKKIENFYLITKDDEDKSIMLNRKAIMDKLID